jgi:hypothetical protein
VAPCIPAYVISTCIQVFFFLLLLSNACGLLYLYIWHDSDLCYFADARKVVERKQLNCGSKANSIKYLPPHPPPLLVRGPLEENTLLLCNMPTETPSAAIRRFIDDGLNRATNRQMSRRWSKRSPFLEAVFGNVPGKALLQFRGKAGKALSMLLRLPELNYLCLQTTPPCANTALDSL